MHKTRKASRRNAQVPVRLSDQRGFSIMQVMMIASLLGVVSVGTISFIKRGTDQQKNLTMQEDVRSVSSHIASYLMDANACYYTFRNKVVNTNTASTYFVTEPTLYGASVATIRNSDDTISLFEAYDGPTGSKSGVFGNRSIRLRYITVGGTGVEPRTGLTRNNTTSGTVLVQLEWEPYSAFTIPGAQRISRFFQLNVTLNGSSQITACTSTGSVTSNANSCLAGTQTFSTVGANSFLVPNYDDTLTATVVGGGGGGAGDSGGGVAAGGTGGTSTFDVLSATGGAGGAVNGGAAGTGGAGSGGDTNASGNAGSVGAATGGAGGAGGGPAAGQGGLAVSGDSNGNPGTLPGGGGGGAINAAPGGSGGGGGGYATKIYAVGTLTAGQHIPLVVGAGGSAGAGTRTGGAGGAGRVVVSWTCAGSESSIYDNLGNHILTRNLIVGSSGYWISGDGDSEGITVDTAGRVGVGTLSPVSLLDLPGGMKIGTDAAACSVAKAGTLRWNGTSADFCNGTTWTSFDSGGASATSGVYYDYQLFTANGTWTKPTGLVGTEPVFVQIWGGGGGGKVSAGQAGGGGGAYNQGWFRASDLSATETVTVGAGGAKNSGSASAGGTSSFDNLSAYGGGGASSATGAGGGGTLAAGDNAANGGAPDGGVSGNPGTDSTMGGGGGAGNTSGYVGGKSYFGGGGAGSGTGNGGNSVYGGGGGGGGTTGATGGTSTFGGAGGNYNTNGNAPGGGGGGGGTAGNGARGEVRVWTLVGRTNGSSGTSDNLGDHTMDMNLQTGNYYISGDGGNEGLFIDATGNVGIGNSSPRAKLDVSGAIVGKAVTTTGSATIDFSQGNIQSSSNSCGAFTLQNIKDGGIYSLAVEGTAGGTCTFTASGFTVYAPVDDMVMPAKRVVYTFVVVGTSVYVAYVIMN